MKKIIMIMFLLLTTVVYVGGRPVDSQAENLERQFIRAGVSANDTQGLLHSMQQAGFTQKQMEQLAGRMTEEDFPKMATNAVREKVLEGIAKRVPPERILQATTNVEKRYQYAMKLTAGLEANTRKRLVQAYADCLAAGLSRRDAERIAAAIEEGIHRGNNSSRFSLREETLFTAREMVRQGVSSATTASILHKALSQGFDGENMRTLRHALRSKHKTNIEEKAQLFDAAIGRGVPPDKLASVSDDAGRNSGNANGTAGSTGGNNSGGSGPDGGGGHDGGSGNGHGGKK